MAFYMVYIREAHPSDGWQLPVNEDEAVVFETPRDFTARAAVAESCVTDLGIEFPALIDDMQNSTDDAYKGWPDRLFLVNRDGTLAYKSKPGPWGFDTDELAAALMKVIEPTEG